MAETTHRTGTVKSGDVTLFYRLFGSKGATPIMILHGANYFDSRDWIGVAGQLAADREVVAFDRRGFGESSWSPSKDYSPDAVMDDINAVADHLDWDKFIIFGHSMSGGTVICYAANFPDRTEKLIIGDSNLSRGEGGGGSPRGNPPTIFKTVDEMMERFAKLNNPPRVSHDRAHAEGSLKTVEGGLMLKRDPDFRNTEPQGAGARSPKLVSQTLDDQMAMIKCPVLLVRGTKSDRYPPDEVERITRKWPHIVQTPVDSQHDIATGAPDQLVAAIRAFVG